MKTLIFAIIISLVSTLGFAECVTLDTSGWTQNKKNMRMPVAYALAYESGQNIVPTVSGKDICFEGSADIDIAVNQTTFDQRYDSDKLALDIADAEMQALSIEFETEKLNSEFRELTLSQIDSKIDAISNLNQMKTALKKLTRLLRAKRAI